MSNEIISALIGAGATIIAALIGLLAKALAQRRSSLSYRRKLKLADPLGKW